MPPEVDRLVVTLAPYRSGDSVVPGTLLAEVSGQPLVALDLSTPLYRDLRLGMSGPDVASLKSGLASLGYSVNPYGDEFDSTVVAALNSLYLSLGYLDHVTKKSTISSGDFIDVSASDLIVTHAARLNSVLGEDEPVLSMAAATKSVTVRVDIVAAEPLVVGAKVRVRIPGTSIRRRGVIDHISGFKQAADDDSVPGHDVRIRLEKTLAPTQSGAGFTATLRGRQRPLPAVPLTALRSAGSEQFVWRAEADEFAQVDVTVREEADGWALLQQSGGLQPGDEVRVLP